MGPRGNAQTRENENQGIVGPAFRRPDMESGIVATMRPAILFPLFGEIRSLPGVGPRIEKLIARVAGTRLVDLVFDLPVGVVDRSYRPKLIEAEPGRIATVTLNVLDHLVPRSRQQPYKVRCSD